MVQQEISDEKIAEIREFVIAGRKIEAIKAFREATGVDLKEAKEAVEAMIDVQPDISSSVKPKGCTCPFVVMVVLSAGVIYAVVNLA